MRGRWSGVAGRNPAQVRITDSPAKAGAKRTARSSIARSIRGSTRGSSFPSCREEPMSIWPVRPRLQVERDRFGRLTGGALDVSHFHQLVTDPAGVP